MSQTTRAKDRPFDNAAKASIAGTQSGGLRRFDAGIHRISTIPSGVRIDPERLAAARRELDRLEREGGATA